MADPIFNNGQQSVNPQSQPADTHQDIFGGSSDIFNNPDMFQPVAPEAAPAQEDFNLDLGQLEANQYTPAPSEPVIIEPEEPQQTRDQYQATQHIPEPEIIEQVIEPEMKPEVKVNPRRQGTTKNEQLTVPKPQQPRPQVRPQQIQQPKPAPVPVRPAQVQPQVRPQQVQVPRPQQARPQVQAQPPRPPQPVQAPVQVVRPPEVQPAPKPVVPERRETTPQDTSSDLQKKLNELITTARHIYALEKKNTDQIIELLGANNDIVTILYQITLPENGITIKKIETDTSTQEEMVNDLGFVLEDNSVQVLLDDVLLFDEIEHLQDNPKKKMQVTEKMNKFIFLLSEHQKKIEKEAKEKEEAESERRRLQDIFRNF